MFNGGKQPSFYLPNQQVSRLSKKQHSPSSDKHQEGVSKTDFIVKTLYLPKIKDIGKASSHGFDDHQMLNSPSMPMQQPPHSPLQTFDNLFYKRLQHIERVLDEDPIQLEKYKNYFNSVVNTKRSGGDGTQTHSTMLANLLMNSNTKDYNLSQERVMNQTTTHRSPHVSNQSLNTSVTNFNNRRGNSTTID